MIHAIFILFIKLNILKNIQYSKNLNITDKLNNNKINLKFTFQDLPSVFHFKSLDHQTYKYTANAVISH